MFNYKFHNFTQWQINPSKVAPGNDLKFQWSLTGAEDGTFIMLNTDMELPYDIDVDNSGSGTKCVIRSQEEKSKQITFRTTNCPVAATKKLVTMYAKVWKCSITIDVQI